MSCCRISHPVSRTQAEPGILGTLSLFSRFPISPTFLARVTHNFLPSNSKLPGGPEARVMLPTSTGLREGREARKPAIGPGPWACLGAGGFVHKDRDSIFSSPSWMSFFSYGICGSGRRAQLWGQGWRVGNQSRQGHVTSGLFWRRSSPFSPGWGLGPISAWSLQQKEYYKLNIYPKLSWPDSGFQNNLWFCHEQTCLL